MREEDRDLGLFDGFPEPVLLLREDKVAYRNQAAAERFLGLRPGDEVPAGLRTLLGEACPPAAAAGRPWPPGRNGGFCSWGAAAACLCCWWR